jgi:DNA-binding MarR family transcriptional regulator
MTPLYLLFTTYAADIKPSKIHLDFSAKELLDIIGCCHFHEPLTVTEAMDLQEIGSPATIHRKLDDLLLAGLIYHYQEPDNKRTKYIKLTPQAIGYYAQLSQAMVTATLNRSLA